MYMYIYRDTYTHVIILYCVSIVFMDYDLKSGFGSPWEVYPQGSYVIISKGGAYGGHSGFLSFIPELQLSM